ENLYIDNLENLERYAQLELLRVIETRTLPNRQLIKGRIFFSATKQILKKIQSGEFREDLFQKIQAVRIEIPSLKEREEDILLFVHHFLKFLNAKYKKQVESVSKKLLEAIQTHSWERNLSELELFLESQIIFSRKILELHSKPILTPKLSNLEIKIGLTLKEYEREIILANLRHFQGNRSKTAKALGISERNLYRKIQEYGLNLD
ncbi:MAG: helix-turn-helix domain-containing protein, partial [Candidatus Pacearchaeota archaeon]